MPAGLQLGGALSDLGLGDMLQSQRQDETEDEKRKRKMGLSVLNQNPLSNFGMTGVAAIDLGMSGAKRG